MDDNLRDALATVEPFAQFNPEDLAVERLGGFCKVSPCQRLPALDEILHPGFGGVGLGILDRRAGPGGLSRVEFPVECDFDLALGQLELRSLGQV